MEIAGRVTSAPQARDTIAAAFAEIALIHRLMSFQEPDSDVSRLNRLPADELLEVDPRTVEVLREARAVSALSAGRFDITVAPDLVKLGHLPPLKARAASADADWRDIEIVAYNAVRLKRPLWLDLGGIAKGYAVDRAIQILEEGGVEGGHVNAGGDIRVSAAASRIIALDVPSAGSDAAVRVTLCGGSIASSYGTAQDIGPHLDGITRTGVNSGRFVSVLAENCMIADALTKVVLALGAAARPALYHCNATAFIHEPASGWQRVGRSLPDTTDDAAVAFALKDS